MAFTYTWNTITAGMVDADSPGNETLFQYIRRNEIHLREWIGKSYYAGATEDHNHDGVNSATVSLGVGVITSAMILDGTIATIDLGNGIVTWQKMAFNAGQTRLVNEGGWMFHYEVLSAAGVWGRTCPSFYNGP